MSKTVLIQTIQMTIMLHIPNSSVFFFLFWISSLVPNEAELIRFIFQLLYYEAFSIIAIKTVTTIMLHIPNSSLCFFLFFCQLVCVDTSAITKSKTHQTQEKSIILRSRKGFDFKSHRNLILYSFYHYLLFLVAIDITTPVSSPGIMANLLYSNFVVSSNASRSIKFIFGQIQFRKSRTHLSPPQTIG